jgi:hypothetical protein
MKKIMGIFMNQSDRAWKRAIEVFPEIKNYDKDAFTIGYIIGVKEVFAFVRAYHRKRGRTKKGAKGKK